MKIIVNEVPIDFELEGESTVGSVVEGVREWLTTNNHVVDTMEIDGTRHDLTDETWQTLPIGQTEEVRISAHNLYQNQIEGLETLITYIGLLRRVMLEGNDEQVRAVLEELPFVIDGIKRITPDLEGLLEEPLRDSRDSLPNQETRQRLAARAAELAILFENRQRELLDPEHEMALTLTILNELLPRFEEVSGELQAGQEKAAMDTVTRFTEVAGRVLRILPRVVEARPALQTELIDDQLLSDAIAGIRDLLSELEGAFQNTDYVLVGDLLEYEVLPRFSSLSSTLERHLNNPR